MPLTIDIAEAVTRQLNDEQGSFSQPFVAVRHSRPSFELAELKELRVSVVPRAISIVNLGRSLNQHDVSVDVAVQKKLSPQTQTAELDELMELLEQIGDCLRLKRLSTMPTAAWVRSENSPIYSPEHLEQHNVFTSVLTITFRVAR